MLVLLCHLLLPYILSLERWVPLLQKGAEPHGVRALLIPLTSVQNKVAREEVREKTFYWIDGSPLLPSLVLVLLSVPTERTSNRISIPVSKIMLLERRQ